MKTEIICISDSLFNGGKCFTKGKKYIVNGHIKSVAGLMEKEVINDMGEPHIIGSWWRNFKIVN